MSNLWSDMDLCEHNTLWLTHGRWDLCSMEALHFTANLCSGGKIRFENIHINYIAMTISSTLLSLHCLCLPLVTASNYELNWLHYDAIICGKHAAEWINRLWQSMNFPLFVSHLLCLPWALILTVNYWETLLPTSGIIYCPLTVVKTLSRARYLGGLSTVSTHVITDYCCYHFITLSNCNCTCLAFFLRKHAIFLFIAEKYRHQANESDRFNE